MATVMVELSPRRPLTGDAPGLPADLPYYTRHVSEPTPPITTITSVGDLDDMMDSAKCSCEAGDDNPH
ncbi:hypothetical protein ACWF95_39195 [Streptomyces vinaceus]